MGRSFGNRRELRRDIFGCRAIDCGQGHFPCRGKLLSNLIDDSRASGSVRTIVENGVAEKNEMIHLPA